MKKLIFTLISVVTLAITAHAQSTWIMDSVSLGAGINDDVFYSMGTGTVRVENNKNWHLGFSLSPIGDSAAIWANHGSGNAYTKVYNIHKDSAQWSTVTLGDTALATLCFNNDKGWYQGAFNNIQSMDPFNFGWGHYLGAPSHAIQGDSIFIVKANGIFYKVFIAKLDAIPAIVWTFTVGDFAGNDVVHTIAKTPNYTNNLFAHFNLATGADTNREPNINTWDVIFNRYTTDAVGSGQGLNNNVVGVLANKGVKTARAQGVQVDSAFMNYPLYTAAWSPMISGIGYDWKTFNQSTFSYSVADSNSYFIRGKDTSVLWQLQFTAYGGSANGNVVFKKRAVWPTAVNDIQSSINSYSIFPIPCDQQLNIVLDAKETAKANITLMDMFGKTILRAAINVNNGLNAYTLPTQSLPNGNYILSINGTSIRINQSIQIVK